MDDFFKQFRTNLDNRPEPAFEERDWRDMQHRLEKQKKRVVFGWWWLALPLLLLLLGLNGAFFYELKKANQKIKTLEIQRDTIYKTQVIYQIDTIYKTRIIRETEIAYRTVDLGMTIPSKILPTATLTGLEENTTQKVNRQQLDLPNLIERTEHPPMLTDFEKIKFLNPELLDMPESPLPAMSKEPIAKKTKKTLAQHLYAMRPKGFQLGIGSGGAFPFSKEVQPIAGFSIGLQGVVELSSSLQLWADARYLNTRFETDRMNAAFGVPPVEPPSDEFKFILAEVPQPSLQFSIGMQYFLNTKNKLQPFMGAGVGAVSLLPHENIYEFKNELNGIEWSLDKAVRIDGISTNFWFVRGGLSYKISEHLQGQFLTNYRGNWKTKDIQFPQLLGIQMGLNYKFK